MKDTIEYLTERRNQIVEHLRNGKQKFLPELQEIDRAINWLKK